MADDWWDRKTTIPCPNCGAATVRVPDDETREVVGITCDKCGHRFDWEPPKK